MKTINVNVGQINVLISVLTTGSAKDIAEMRKINRALNVIEEKVKPNEKIEGEVELEFEDADFETLKNRFNSFENWNLQAQKLVLEVDKIINN